MDTDPLAIGRNGATNVTTGTVAGQWYAIQFLGETVIAAIAASNDSDGGTALARTYADGSIIYGQFTSITVTSGTARCYKINPQN